MNKKKSSNDTESLYTIDYFLKNVDGYECYAEFDGSYDQLYSRYKRNVQILGLDVHHKFVEYGCGRGEICIFHATRGGRSIGIDYSQGAINLAKAKAKNLGVEVEFHAISFANFKPKSESVDRILASEFIEHISEFEAEMFLRNAFDSLSVGGKILIYTHPNTLQRRFGYPIVRFASRLIGKKMPKKQPDTILEHYKLYHLNEQNYYSLTRLAQMVNASKYVVGYDVYGVECGDGYFKKSLRRFIGLTPLRHWFFSGLYLIIEK